MMKTGGVARIAVLAANLRLEMEWLTDSEAPDKRASLEEEAQLETIKEDVLEALNLVQGLRRKAWQRAKVGGPGA